MYLCIYMYIVYIYIILSIIIHDFTARSFLFSKSSGRFSHLWLHLVPKVHCPFPLHGLCKSVIQRRVFDNLMWNTRRAPCKPWRNLFARHIQILYILTKWLWRKRFLVVSIHLISCPVASVPFRNWGSQTKKSSCMPEGAEGSTMLQERITAP